MQSGRTSPPRGSESAPRARVSSQLSVSPQRAGLHTVRTSVGAGVGGAVFSRRPRRLAARARDDASAHTLCSPLVTAGEQPTRARPTAMLVLSAAAG